MMLKKWNYKSKTYEPYAVPDEWNVKTYCADMYEIVNCPHCGKELTFGETYTSHEIHTASGMGYGVCEKCYFEDENKRWAEMVMELKRKEERKETKRLTREECKRGWRK